MQVPKNRKNAGTWAEMLPELEGLSGLPFLEREADAPVRSNIFFLLSPLGARDSRQDNAFLI